MSFHSSDTHWIGERLPPAPHKLHIDADNRFAVKAASESIKTGKPLILIGAVGTGKTTLLGVIARGVRSGDLHAGTWHPARSDRPYQTWMDEPFIFTRASEFVADAKADWSRKAGDVPAGVEALYRAEGLGARCRRLFLDDLGVEEASARNVQIIVDLLTARHDRELPTWITTNLMMGDIVERYGSRVGDRLRQTHRIIDLLGDSRRRGAA